MWDIEQVQCTCEKCEKKETKCSHCVEQTKRSIRTNDSRPYDLGWVASKMFREGRMKV